MKREERVKGEGVYQMQGRYKAIVVTQEFNYSVSPYYADHHNDTHTCTHTHTHTHTHAHLHTQNHTHAHIRHAHTRTHQACSHTRISSKESK